MMRKAILLPLTALFVVAACDQGRPVAPDGLDPQASESPAPLYATDQVAGEEVPDPSTWETDAEDAAPASVLASNIQLGIWFPYVSNAGVPPLSSFAANGITATFLAGNIDATVLANYDVLFFGRAGMTGNYPPGAGVISDLNALINWVSNGGGIIGESEAFIRDSDVWRGANWSSQLSNVAGVWSTQPDGIDLAVSNPTVNITDPGHPIAQGVSASFTLSGYHAYEAFAFRDLGRNPTAIEIGKVNNAPIVTAQFGAGCSVYFPAAVGYGGMNWAANPDYEQLFINAVTFCGGPIQVDIDIKPGSFPNSINPKSMGVVPVAVLGSEDFDVTDIDVTTLAFGPAGASPAHDLTDAATYAGHLQDVNSDGFTDLVSHYRQKETGLTAADTEACIEGDTTGGRRFEGCDSVRVLDK